MTNELVVVENGSVALASHKAATDAAGVCREIVLRTAQSIQGRKYVRVEGWQAIANGFGCVASAADVRRVEGGIAATGQVRRVSDGAILATGEGFVGDDEGTWAKRPEFARRAMAQTRAISRACRAAFAYVVVMLDAGLETTPAEEMVGVDLQEPIQYRPKPDPAGLERRPGRVRVNEKAPPPADTTAQKARLAISKCGSVDELDKLRRKLDERMAEGAFDQATHRELVGLALGRAEILTGIVQEGEA